MKIGSATIFYNDLRGVERLVPTLDDLDVIIMNDGAWKDFGDSELSDDGSREFLLQNKKIKLIDNYGLMPHEKQNKHLKLAGELGVDVLLLIDADEYLSVFDRGLFISDFESKIESGVNVYLCDFNFFDLTWGHTVVPRIIYRPSECEYKNRHNQIWAHDAEQIGRPRRDLEIKGIEITHDKSVRTQEREEYNRKWNLEHPRH